MKFKTKKVIIVIFMFLCISQVVIAETNNPIDLEVLVKGPYTEGRIKFIDANREYLVIGLDDDRIDFYDRNDSYIQSFKFKLYNRYYLKLEEESILIIDNFFSTIYVYDFNGDLINEYINENESKKLTSESLNRDSVSFNDAEYSIETNYIWYRIYKYNESKGKIKFIEIRNTDIYDSPLVTILLFVVITMVVIITVLIIRKSNKRRRM